MTSQTQTKSTSNKLSSYLMLIVLIVMALAAVALFLAFETFLFGGQENQLSAIILAGLGLIALATSVFLLYQSRKQATEAKIDIPKVMTIIECQNKACNNKIIREFQRGDYVFKDLDTTCPKCGGRQMITAVYKEIKEKEKTYAI
ncbi:MAG: hypothetical protein LBH74_02360 [Nitrososphaerota archaeon]|jgi:hypothetical protein|uniref:hypothetical protein n=1 Tax=Candidatus Bathycorpusculum sp. TaxID=2994959 RepID=UPI002816B554|nr:hypothetical protein [Candidatus Termitimicrobium sp.]MCL2431509.1 hypothetical protein [Candidatus Termitimicrobium sp.]MDR0492469.1 hypothetical protein [Nitrososphaerota archaeon]